jgi:type I restriction enzyme M protein
MAAHASSFKERPKNVLTDDGIEAVAASFETWETKEKLSRVLNSDEVRAADYNLSPSQFVSVGEKVTHRPLAEILADLEDARAERERADERLHLVLSRLGLSQQE